MSSGWLIPLSSEQHESEEISSAPFRNLTFVREASHIDFVHEKRHIDVLLETLQPPLETSRTFFDSAEAPEALFILQA